MWDFCFLKLFCSLVKNENTKRPGFYTLRVKVFLNFPQKKQLNKIKNTCEYCVAIFFSYDLLELEIRDSYKKLY